MRKVSVQLLLLAGTTRALVLVPSCFFGSKNCSGGKGRIFRAKTETKWSSPLQQGCLTEGGREQGVGTEVCEILRPNSRIE